MDETEVCDVCAQSIPVRRRRRLAIHHTSAGLCSGSRKIPKANQSAPGKTKRLLAECGTQAARQRHARRDEACKICDAMPGHPEIVCGTTAGYGAHRRRKERACEECIRANTAYNVERRALLAAERAATRLAAGLPAVTRRHRAVAAVAPVTPTRPPVYENPLTYARLRGTHCAHCSTNQEKCRNYHMWDCFSCKTERTARLAAAQSERMNNVEREDVVATG